MENVEELANKALYDVLDETDLVMYEYRGYDRSLRCVEFDEINANTPRKYRDILDKMVRERVGRKIATIIYKTENNPSYWSDNNE